MKNPFGEELTIRSKIICKIIFVLLFALQCNLSASTYFVSTNGSNTNDGSINNPWASIVYALSKLASNDTLYLRGGVYYEKGFNIINKTGILFSAYQNEKVEITGGVPDFRVTPNDKWELFDASVNLYRSKNIFPATTYVNAWLLDDGIQIVQYDNINNLKSTNY
jgi:hypothetical protein